MKLLIESEFLRLTEMTEDKLYITIVSISVLHAWQILQQEKSLHRISGKSGCHITYVYKQAEQLVAPVFLLQYKKNMISNSENIWVQWLEKIPDNYLNLHLKLTV